MTKTLHHRGRFALIVGLLLAATQGPTTSALAQTSATNAADLYAQMESRLRGTAGSSHQGPLFDSATWDRFNQVLWGGPISQQVRDDLQRAQQVIDLAQRAAAFQEIDRKINYSDGYLVEMPHLVAMREATRLLQADAAVRIADGDVNGAAERFGATLAFCDHVASDGMLISTLVSAAIGSLSGDRIQNAIGMGVIDADAATTLLEFADRLDGADPFGFAGALEGEFDLLRTTVLGVAEGVPRFGGLINSLGPDAEGRSFAEYSREDFLGELELAESIYSEAADAARDPDPEAAMLRLAALEQRVAAGEGGMICKMLAPAFTNAFEMSLLAREALTNPLQQLRSIASGEKTPADFTNAAVWLRQAALAAERLTVDEQRLLEAMRLAPEAFDGDDAQIVRDEIRAIVDRHRDAIIEPLLTASVAARCRFRSEVENLRQVSGISEYAPGLRGAVRFLLVEALLETPEIDANATAVASNQTLQTEDEGKVEGEDEDEGGSELEDEVEGDAVADGTSATPPTRLERLAAAVRVIDLVAGDTRLDHAILATAMMADLADATPRIIQRHPPDDAPLAALRLAVERIDRTDPLGHQRGLAAIRRTFANLYRCDDVTRSKRIELAAHLDANRAFSLALVLQPLRDHGARRPCELIDRGPLLSMRDLIDPEVCLELREVPDALVVEAPVLHAGRSTPATTRDPLGGVVLPTTVDAAELKMRAVSLIGDLDQIVRNPATSPPSS